LSTHPVADEKAHGAYERLGCAPPSSESMELIQSQIKPTVRTITGTIGAYHHRMAGNTCSIE
jgi:hypothetical protein